MKSTISEVMHIPATLAVICHFPPLQIDTQFPQYRLYERLWFLQCTYLLLHGDESIFFLVCFHIAIQKYSGERDLYGDIFGVY